jgi:hypothetical protein
MLKQYTIAIAGSAGIPESLKELLDHTPLNNVPYRLGKYARSYNSKFKQVFM